MKQLGGFLIDDAELLSQHYLGKELARQLVRSLDSICANIEEGYGRKAGKEFKQFLRTARGSARESYGRYARCRKFLPQETVRERRAKLDEILAMLFSLIGKLSD